MESNCFGKQNYEDREQGIGWLRRILSMFYVGVFLLILVLPIIAVNKVGGGISETENRRLAGFPDIFDTEGHFTENLRDNLVTWYGDNIGFREQFVKMSNIMKYYFLHQSTTQWVEIGKDGWYFATANHNIELADSEFVLSNDVLQKIANKQQRISDWYADQGIKYILVLTPAKTSIYPEYIASRDVEVQTTICDQVEQVLNEYTTVQVINLKHVLLDNKSNGQVFLKTDTHFSPFGSYTAYLAVAERLNELGVQMKDFPVELCDADGRISGDLGRALGWIGISEKAVPTAKWDQHSFQVTSGSFYDTLTQLQRQNNEAAQFPVIVYENPTESGNGTLLIYGDSQWMPERLLPLFFSESFGTVASMRFREVNMNVDEIAKPDVVIFGAGERTLDDILMRPCGVPEIAKQLPALPSKQMISSEEYGKWIGKQGVNLDKYNDKTLEDGKLSVDAEVESVKLYGWGADFWSDEPFLEMYCQVGDVLLKCDYGIERAGVAQNFGKDSLLKTGFQVVFPTSYLKGGEVAEVAFIGVSSDGNSLYAPVTYHLNYSTG